MRIHSLVLHEDANRQTNKCQVKHYRLEIKSPNIEIWRRPQKIR